MREVHFWRFWFWNFREKINAFFRPSNLKIWEKNQHILMVAYVHVHVFHLHIFRRNEGGGGYKNSVGLGGLRIRYIILYSHATWRVKYCMSRKSWPNLYSNLLYKMCQDFLDIQRIFLTYCMSKKSCGNNLIQYSTSIYIYVQSIGITKK